MKEKLELYISDAMHDCKNFLYWQKKGDLQKMRSIARYVISDLTSLLKESEDWNDGEKKQM